MKVKCINIDDWVGYFTIGKTYEVIVEYQYCYSIINDKGQEMLLQKGYCKPLSEYRIEKIDKLLDL